MVKSLHGKETYNISSNKHENNKQNRTWLIVMIQIICDSISLLKKDIEVGVKIKQYYFNACFKQSLIFIKAQFKTNRILACNVQNCTFIIKTVDRK